MKRRNFISATAGVSVAAAAGIIGCIPVNKQGPFEKAKALDQSYPLAITMWEFSWLERRWPGAGYEDWDQALSELVERGYDAIRIDPFPHLFYKDPEREYLLYPQWSTQDWGSPEINKIRVQPNLNKFLEKCKDYNVRVGLSSWFREDSENSRMLLDTPQKLAEAWLKVLKSINEAGLLDTIFYVDLCNEWTGDAWCPFFVNDPPEAKWSGWHTEKSRDWMSSSISILRAEFPEIPYTFSFTEEVNENMLKKDQLEMLDMLEHHIWMTSFNGGEFYREVGYNYERFDYTGYRNMALNGQKAYAERREYWNKGLVSQIRLAAEWSRIVKRPLVTTECWGVVDYKDWPLLDWGYVKELCALGVEEAAKTGRWLAIASSNFCGPQFKGMWRDIEWHKKLTGLIHESHPDEDIKNSILAKRMKSIVK